MKLVVGIASEAEDLPCLDDFGSETVGVHGSVRTRAWLDKLRCDSYLLQISLLLESVCAEHFQKLRQGGLWQPFYVVVTSENRPVALA